MLNALPAKTPTEAKVVSWDFSEDTDAALSSPAVAATVLRGTDPLAVGLIVSTAVISGSTVYALVANGVDNVTYELLCTVQDSAGQVHQSAASLTVTSDAA